MALETRGLVDEMGREMRDGEELRIRSMNTSADSVDIISLLLTRRGDISCVAGLDHFLGSKTQTVSM